jgi:hypothetical protein
MPSCTPFVPKRLACEVDEIGVRQHDPVSPPRAQCRVGQVVAENGRHIEVSVRDTSVDFVSMGGA